MGTSDMNPNSLYDVLGIEIAAHDEDPNKPPDTTYTATIETIDNDRLHAFLSGNQAI